MAEAKSNRRGFLRGLASLPLIGGGIALTGRADPLTPEAYIREIRAIGNHSFVLMKGQPIGGSPYWYYIDCGDETTYDQRDAFADIEHRYRKIKTIEFHERVRDLLVGGVNV